mmetsp:Transcript_16322/g.41177  ORF Transcript_16322/g.41177 Transcript_16322/m.41177 type:complete len:226 (-) Transcript_16322:216-893(-)
MPATPYSLRHTAVPSSLSAALPPCPPLPRTYLSKSTGVRASTHAWSIPSLCASLSARTRSLTTPMASASLRVALPCSPNLAAARCSALSSRSGGASPANSASSASASSSAACGTKAKRAMAPKNPAVAPTAALSIATSSPRTTAAAVTRPNRLRDSRSWRERSLCSRPDMREAQAANIQKLPSTSATSPIAPGEKLVGELERSAGSFLAEGGASGEAGEWNAPTC